MSAPVLRTVIDRTPFRADAAEGFKVDPAVIKSLRARLEGRIEGELRFEAGDLALYATDASNYRQTPFGVVAPKTIEDVLAVVEACEAHDLPITPRGGGTSLAGQTCNTAVVIDFSKYMREVLWLDPDRRLAEVQPGCILDTLRNQAERHHLTFGPDPATHSRNTLGGMIGNDSCGAHSVMAGRTADNVHALDIVTYDGFRMSVGATSREAYERILVDGGRRAQIYRDLRAFWDRYGERFLEVYPRIPRRVSGYENLDQLAWDKDFNVARALVGTEAGCVVVLKATLNLVPSPPARVLAIVGFEDVFAAADAAPQALEHGPIALEGMDDLLLDYLTRKHMDQKDVGALPKGGGWLIAEFGGDDPAEAKGKADKLAARFAAHGSDTRVLTAKPEQMKVWRIREDALAATAHVPGVGETYPGWEDSAVPPGQLGRYLRDLKALFRKHGYEASVYGHFGDGLVHCRVPFDLRSERGLQNWTAFLTEASDLVVGLGGSLSGEHGDGQARAALLSRMYPPELMEAQRAFKAIWDPRGRLNPGKVIDPYPITANLRLGPTYRRPHIPGRFAYPEDDNNFAKTAERCVGVGACREPDSDKHVMCPSFMATKEEKHSTRGRARLLFEMIHGGAIDDGWRSQAVEEALDLCLACKGCKSDCPVHVDMATYKAEFRSHHYEGRLRPRAAYSMGQIRTWAELAQIAPWAANLALRTPGLAAMAKSAAGISQRRKAPLFALQSFQAWSRRRQKPVGGERVLLWPDTFNNFFRPHTAIAATRLLESYGLQVSVPEASLCCGRPLFDWGWIDRARALWRRTLNALAPDIEAGTPLVGLEPGCISTFRDELRALFPGDPTAERLAGQTFMLSEFMARRGLDPPKVSGEALVQIHCHHHAVLDPASELEVLKAAGIDAEKLASGCCGMAGSFGFEAEKYEVSMAAGERVLLPKVRAAPRGTLILADGFSCREQIEQGARRRTTHLAEALARGLD